jgi:hypothetical protein
MSVPERTVCCTSRRVWIVVAAANSRFARRTTNSTLVSERGDRQPNSPAAAGVRP